MGSRSIITLSAGICFTLAGNLIGLTGYSWWRTDNFDHGLWRYCETLPGTRGRLYHIRKNLASHKEYFIATILLGVSCGFLIISFVSTTLAFVYQDIIKRKNINLIVSAVSVFLASILGLSSLIYIEVVMKQQFVIMDRSWSNICCWLGYGVSVFVFILSVHIVYVDIKTSTRTAAIMVEVGPLKCSEDKEHKQVKFRL